MLRNGLDYLNYQQYERALKFLREAEAHQKELNDAEKRALKRGIERAQRGLREAAEADTPYAVSERSRRRNGFTVAKSEAKSEAKTEMKAADNSDPADQPARQSRQPAGARRLGTEPEDRGEPIRLASVAETPAQTSTQSRVDSDEAPQHGAHKPAARSYSSARSP